MPPCIIEQPIPPLPDMQLPPLMLLPAEVPLPPLIIPLPPMAPPRPLVIPLIPGIKEPMGIDPECGPVIGIVGCD
jgi:hypothetical protein